MLHNAWNFNEQKRIDSFCSEKGSLEFFVLFFSLQKCGPVLEKRNKKQIKKRQRKKYVRSDFDSRKELVGQLERVLTTD